ncbi:peptidylprolyl isomerase [Neptunitalea chrysea]|uniref:peptidylprolyl isomerase n=1 Tax=Neptunitalea chrysea TaxID=1647581 RepID=A0A9W6B924_9FLAO|nr:peptidylprolyl isomerase [Neptunitalea chrysea]GLB53834.1 peptidylprolyl isomerase [Neptunitalea chrysea]
MKKILILSMFTLLAVAAGSCQKKQYRELGDGLFADIQTNKGNMIVKLYYDATPATVASFVSLAEGTNEYVTDSLKGKPYYDGVIFHRVMKDFMIQGGDILGTGSGDPGYKFEDEFVDTLKFDGKGILAMANSGRNTNGSQFFITHKETPWLNGAHTIFGKVVKGEEIIDTIANVKVNPSNSKPIDSVIINHVEIIKNGRNAKKFKAAKVFDEYYKEKIKREEERKAKLAAQKKAATTTDSGLQLLFLNKSEDGEQPKQGSKVLVYYSGYLDRDGELVAFASNIESVIKENNLDKKSPMPPKTDPAIMDYSSNANLIAGVKEALLQMKVGDKVRVFIPYYLGYGDRGAGRGLIPPKSDLVFDLEIVSIAEPTAAE